MSGGSYDYASNCFDIEGVLKRREGLQRLADSLMELSAFQEGIDTMMIIQLVKQWDDFVQKECTRLGAVWHALEWWKSGDWNEWQFRQALEQHRSKD